MAIQNLVSATLDAAAKAEILASLTRIKERLNFLVTLQPDEARRLVRAGKGFAKFIERAHQAITDHPEIIPIALENDMEEFKRDLALIKDLTLIVNLTTFKRRFLGFFPELYPYPASR